MTIQVPFVKKTVASVMSSFTKTIDDLQAVAQREYTASNLYVEQADELAVKAAAAQAEGAQAEKIAEKLRQLVA